jgi:hypothetical protein
MISLALRFLTGSFGGDREEEPENVSRFSANPSVERRKLRKN